MYICRSRRFIYVFDYCRYERLDMDILSDRRTGAEEEDSVLLEDRDKDLEGKMLS
jgi:hypothetical protein